MKLIRYNHPEFTDLISDFDRIFRNSFAGFPRFSRFGLGGLAEPGPLLSAPQLAADLFEDDENYYARVELPGVNRKEVKVELENSVLTITYEKATARKDEEAVAYRRSLTVPKGVNSEKVSAALKDGILTVTLPRAEKKTPKEITIE